MSFSDVARWCCLLLVVTCVGCGSETAGKPKTFPVKGTITRNGKPVEKATVSFISPESSRAASGLTDAQGKFILGTFGNADGAVAGEHVVTVSKVTQTAEVSSAAISPQKLAEMAAKGQMKAPAPDESVPPKYSDPKTSGLKASVKGDGQDEFTFDLTD